MFNGGDESGEKSGKPGIETGKKFSTELKQSFPEETPDHRIPAITEYPTATNCTELKR